MPNPQTPANLLIHRSFPIQKLFNEAKGQCYDYLVLMAKMNITQRPNPITGNSLVKAETEFKAYPISGAAELRKTGYGIYGNKILGIYDLSMSFQEANDAILHIPLAFKDQLCAQNLRMQQAIRSTKNAQKGLLETLFGPKEKPLTPKIGIGPGAKEPSIFD